MPRTSHRVTRKGVARISFRSRLRVVFGGHAQQWVAVFIEVDGDRDRSAADLAILDVALRARGRIDKDRDRLAAIRTRNVGRRQHRSAPGAREEVGLAQRRTGDAQDRIRHRAMEEQIGQREARQVTHSVEVEFRRPSPE